MNNHPALFPRVFVYGTLKKNYPASGMLAGAQFLGDCYLIGYAMRHCGNFPAAMPTNDVAHRIAGEVYELNMESYEKMLQNLDRYEHVEGGLYTRNEVSTAMFGKVFVYAQTVPTYSYDYIQDGVWLGPKTPAYTIVGGGMPPLANHSNVSNFSKTTPPAKAPAKVVMDKGADLMTLLYGSIEVIRRPKTEESKNAYI
jgi:gamma-glutamylcyclotransferase (GGCT)/AIG2-like uncharacterized protein YtfP